MRRPLASLIAAAILLSACDALRGSPPAPTPGSFGDFAIELRARGIEIDNVISGDPGCNDVTLAPTAIAFRASGLDQAGPVQLRIYLFGDDDAYSRRRADVDTCVQTWATDPATFEFVDASPFVLAGQGPWAADFTSNLRAAVTNAAGD